MLAGPRPACSYWGKDRIAIYNEAFVTIAFSRHPAMMGSPAKVALPATWPFLSEMFLEVERSGVAFSCPDFEMMVNKTNDFLEEAWYDGIWSPITGLDGSVEGFYNSGYENTRLKMIDRRSRVLHQISSPPDFHKKTIWDHIVDACRPHDRDISGLALYSMHSDEPTHASSDSLRLSGHLGIPEGHRAIEEALDLNRDNDGFAPIFRECKANGEPTVLDMPNDELPVFLEGVKWRGFEEPSNVVVAIPLFVTGLIAGFMVVGLNPRRPYDDDHKQFVDDLWHVTTAVLSENISFEQARAREARLSKELTEREKFIRKLARVATVGIYSTSATDTITYANSKFYDITGISSKSENAHNLSFFDCVLAEDKPKVHDAFHECRLHKTTTDRNIRLQQKWTPPGSSIEQHLWILNSITSNVEDGEVTGVIGCITDISHTMWALQLQKNSTKAAEELKRQQERFIDVTSHEMRNPLGAVMQCADGVRSLLDRCLDPSSQGENMSEVLLNIRESVQTILPCTAHQKRIIDDILTVSKLDSTLLTITPVLVEPSVVAESAMRMFKAEFEASDIVTRFNTDKSYDLTSAHCDPTRLTQILINLLTNAIKFTKTSSIRQVNLTIGTSKFSPPSDIAKLQWFPKNGSVPTGACTDEEIYLTFNVSDTGTGMSADEMKRLSDRFRQASPMTHTQYGGSGLGLYISRELTELQGGAIGASSTPGEGSTFGFYIKARKVISQEVRSHQSRISVSLNTSLSKITSAGSPSAPPSKSAGKYEILLVEDNLINQRVLAKQLRQRGCTVHVANHGLEALDFIKTTKFWPDNNGTGKNLTAILMDWEMPVCDGLTATRRLREMQVEETVTEHLTVIAITANVRPEQVETTYKAGVDDLLSKPFAIDQVMKKIDSL